MTEIQVHIIYNTVHILQIHIEESKLHILPIFFKFIPSNVAFTKLNKNAIVNIADWIFLTEKSHNVLIKRMLN